MGDESFFQENKCSKTNSLSEHEMDSIFVININNDNVSTEYIKHCHMLHL